MSSKIEWTDETGMVTTQEVFLPHVRMTAGRTFYQQLLADGLKQLPLIKE